jgi:tetratricopeptide (TPR) repeat protein
MDKTEKETFNIKETVNQTPFDSLSAQAFLKKWAKINDDIKIKFLPREKWEEKKEKGSFREKSGGGMVLFLPDDLHLWEMVGITEEIDRDTFAEKPERAEEKKAEMKELGKMFKNAGSYISARLQSVKEGQEIAEAMAEEFSSYGKMLAKDEDDNAADLSPEETTETDKWLLGENLSASRLGQMEEEEEKEEKRRETIAQFFRVAKKAFELQNSRLSHAQASGEPWKDTTPIHSSFLQKVKQSISGEAEKPKWELEGAIFRRGMENLLKNLERPANRELISLAEYYTEKLFGKETAASFFGEQEKLVETLHLSDLKKELSEVREEGDLSAIGEKEKEIALKISRAVSSFPFKSGANNPADIIADKYINCVGASILGGALLSEVGIVYLVAEVPEHSLTFLITADDKIIWQDMLSPCNNEELQDSVFEGKNDEGKHFTAADIVDFSKKPSASGLMLAINEEVYLKKLPHIREEERKNITLFGPETGQQIQLLSNTTNAFIELQKYEEAVETAKQALALSPKHLSLYNNLGNALLKSGRYREAIIEYKKILSLNPEYSFAYGGIGDALLHLGDISGAKETFEKAVSLHPKDFYAHLGLGIALSRLNGSEKEAEEELKEAISLNYRLPEPYLHLSKLLKKTGRMEESERAREDYLARKN